MQEELAMSRAQAMKRQKAAKVVKLQPVKKARPMGPVDQSTVDTLYKLYQQALEGRITGLLYYVTHADDHYSNGVTGLVEARPEQGVYGAGRLLYLCNKAMDAKIAEKL
jgi:hypothetical protein